MSTGRDKFRRYKIIINVCVYASNMFPRFLRIFIWDYISRYSQVLFIAFRYIIFKSLVRECGENVRLGENLTIRHWENIEVGSNVSIHANCYLDGAGGIKIGDDVSIAHSSTLLSSNHSWNDKSVPIKYNPIIYQKLIINNDVWIGCACRILAGVHLHSRVIVAAGAVVNKSVKKNSIVGGIPARTIKEI